jgi:hypothetical protein
MCSQKHSDAALLREEKVFWTAAEQKTGPKWVSKRAGRKQVEKHIVSSGKFLGKRR